jgi:hypothetical protein
VLMAILWGPTSVDDALERVEQIRQGAQARSRRCRTQSDRPGDDTRRGTRPRVHARRRRCTPGWLCRAARR